MLNRRRVTLLSFVASAILGGMIGLQSDSANAGVTTYYAMSCRGGMDLKVELQQVYNATTFTLVLYHSKSGSKASKSMAAGSCAWNDRAMSANEPIYVQIAGVNEDQKRLVTEIADCMRDPNCIVSMKAGVDGTALKVNLGDEVYFKRGT